MSFLAKSLIHYKICIQFHNEIKKGRSIGDVTSDDAPTYLTKINANSVQQIIFMKHRIISTYFLT